MGKPKDVDSYIAEASIEARQIMETLREIIKSTIPEAEEGISWNVPIYKYHGILAGFDAFKHHVTFGLDALTSEDRQTLKEKGYKTGTKTIQIQFGQEVPAAEIQQTLRSQAEINELKKK